MGSSRHASWTKHEASSNKHEASSINHQASSAKRQGNRLLFSDITCVMCGVGGGGFWESSHHTPHPPTHLPTPPSWLIPTPPLQPIRLMLTPTTSDCPQISIDVPIMRFVIFGMPSEVEEERSDGSFRFVFSVGVFFIFMIVRMYCFLIPNKTLSWGEKPPEATAKSTQRAFQTFHG